MSYYYGLIGTYYFKGGTISTCCGAGACAGAASFSSLELEPQPDLNPNVKYSEFRT
jgi:hypothetical protein